MSVRGLFEEIKHLKKENLDLKLKIYFLEDSNSQSNKIKELMDYNVKLKIEVDDSNAEVERKKMLIEETIGILDVQQTKLDEYEKKIALLGMIKELPIMLTCFWLRQELKDSLSPSVRPVLVCLELSIFIFLAQISLRSQTEPKILFLVS